MTTQGAYRGTTSLLLWGQGRLLAVNLATSKERLLDIPWATAVVLAAIEHSTGEIEAVVAVRDGARIVTFGTDAHAQNIVRLPARYQFEAATYAGGRWWLNSPDSLGNLWMSEWNGERLLDRGTIDRKIVLNPLSPAMAHLSPHGGDVLVTMLHHPFATFLIDSAAQSTPRRLADLDSIALAQLTESSVAANWISLRAVSAGEGIVQVLADLNSDRRVLVTRDSSGKRIRAKLLTAPLGFLTSVDAHRTVLALRATTAPEIVEYAVTWRAPH
ncbi:MAG: hypothetical protein V4617_08100 [Gemmatimonadota bacterium]